MINFSQFLNLILFLVVIILVFYLPGRLFLRIFNYKFERFIVTLASSLVVGISLFLFGVYLLSWIKLEYLYNLIIPVVFLFEYKNFFREFKQNISSLRNSLWEGLLIIFGSSLMAYLTWNSGSYSNGGMLFYGVNGGDSVYHLALIGSLIANFPPLHPGLSGIVLNGYNFFYDFLISNFAKFYHFNAFDLFFRYFSLLISLIYGLTSLALAKFLKLGKRTTLLFLLLMYFAQSFDFFLNYIYRAFNFYYNSAGITQSLVNILDPSVILSVSFIFVGFIILFSKKNTWSFILPALVIGVIPQIKIYSAIIFYVGLLAVSLIEIVKAKSFYFLKVFIFSGIISAIVYLPMNYGAGGLVFAPLLIYKNFIDSAWIFNNWHWNVNFVIYLQHNNYLHIAYFYAVAILIFVVSGLGVRILTILDINKIFKRNFYNSKNIFWLSSIVVSFLIPSFFVQTVSALSVIQFFWVGYMILLLPTAIVLGSRLEKISVRVFFVSLFLLAILFVPDLIKVFETYSVNPGIIDQGLVNQTKFLSTIPQKDGIMVINRDMIKNKYVDLYGSPIFSALSGHSIYYESELTSFTGLGNIIYSRRTNIDEIAYGINTCKSASLTEDKIISIMKNTGNKYLLILKKNKCTEQFRKLNVINEEENSILYNI